MLDKQTDDFMHELDAAASRQLCSVEVGQLRPAVDSYILIDKEAKHPSPGPVLELPCQNQKWQGLSLSARQPRPAARTPGRKSPALWTGPVIWRCRSRSTLPFSSSPTHPRDTRTCPRFVERTNPVHDDLGDPNRSLFFQFAF